MGFFTDVFAIHIPTGVLSGEGRVQGRVRYLALPGPPP